MSLTDLREGIAANLSAIPDIQVSPHMLTSPTPPCAHVFPASVEYDEAMQRGFDEYTLTVQVLVAANADVGAQRLLDEFLAPVGTKSVKQKIESDRTLGGAAFDSQVTACTGYRVFAVEGQPALLGAEWTVLAQASGTT